MVTRILLLLLMAGSLAARASDAIYAQVGGASATVSQPHVTAELIPETTTIEAGKPFDVILHLRSDPGWHTYWINPGDAGLATRITWTLPQGFTAGPIQWPTPEKHDMGGLMTYGYDGDIYLLTTITPPKSDLPQHFDLKAKAEWLVCKEECIPGRADLTLPLDSGLLNLRLPIDNKDFFDEARERLPVPNTRWEVKAAYETVEHQGQPTRNDLRLEFNYLKPSTSDTSKNVQFFPEQGNVLSTKQGDGFTLDPSGSIWSFALEQNGEKPDQLSGVLVSDQPLIGNSKAVYLPLFSVRPDHLVTETDQFAGISATNSIPSSANAPPLGIAAAAGNADDGHRPPLQGEPEQGPAPATLLTVLGFAFIGGLILNLMPCVLPVLSLKVFSLMKHAEDARKAWIQGVAFTAGVVLSFWVLAGLLLILRAAGNQIGWGFQMQDPHFVLGLIFLFFLLGLNLFGVFELGSSLVGLDAKATGHLGGLASSFGNGALATLAATPCTGPFMGSALGFAAQQPAYISMLIFTFLAFGMATPYLLLTIFPGALRFVPKPGAWMEAFKQFMGFLLLATVIFLVYVFGALTGESQVPALLFVLLLAAVAAWVYGRWGVPRTFFYIIAVALIYCASEMGVFSGDLRPISAITSPLSLEVAKPDMDDKDWQPWTQAAVDEALAKGQPVFVDFTAAWCLSCKVNERVALGKDAVKQAFAQKNVALFRADWTQADPEISKTLQQYNRDGVPLYLLYSPKDKANPQVLPEVLTPGIVLDALGKL